MQQKRIGITLCLLSLLVILGLPMAKITAEAATRVLPTNVTTAGEGNALVGVEGSYATDVKEAIKLVNKYRLEACEKGYPDPRDPDRKLTKSDYVPIKWSSDLEYIARIRAAEANIYEDHTRPNGKSCFSIMTPNGVGSYAEVLAWAGSTIVNSVNMWYCEKSDWVKQTKGAITGHYTSMINPRTTHMGMANMNGVGAGEFTNAEWISNFQPESVVLDETPLPAAKNVIQTVEVKRSDLSKKKVNIASKLTMGTTQNLRLTYTYQNSKKVYDLGTYSWSCNSDKVTLTSNGEITAKQIGKYKITFSYDGSERGSCTKTITIIPKTPKIRKVTMGKRSAKVKFKKVAGVSGYQVRYIYGSFWYPKYKTYKVSKNATTKTVKQLTSNTQYGFTIRSYKKVGKKTYYSEWADFIYKKTKR